MKKINNILFVIAGCLSMACSSDYDLKKTIYVPDKENPGLPIYSEKGYNTFGVYYDRVPFIAGDQTPVKVSVNEDGTSFQFDGKLGGTYEEMSVTLVLADFSPDEYLDLMELHKKDLDLTDPTYQVSVRIQGIDYPAEILNGTFSFKRAQSMTVDQELFEVILSGTFEFQAIINTVPVTVSNGRFDVGVGEHNFYKL